MRTRLLAVLLCLCGLAVGGCGDDDGPIRYSGPSCKKAWADLHQTNGENGNTAVAGTRLAAVWDTEQAEAARLAKEATEADCPGRLNAALAHFDALIDLGYAQGDVDMEYQLAGAERDLAHAVSMRDYDPLPQELALAFKVLREQAPLAKVALADQLDELADVNLDDAQEVENALDSLFAAAEADPASKACRTALSTIGDFELSEE